MSDLSLSGSEVLQWADESAAKWFALMEEQPEILALPCDIMNVQSVAQLMQHIVAVELRFAQRLIGHEITPYEQIPYGSVAKIAATHKQAHALFEELLKQPDYDWEGSVRVRHAHCWNLQRIAAQDVLPCADARHPPLCAARYAGAAAWH